MLFCENVFVESLFLCMLVLYVCESLYYEVRGERFILWAQHVQSLFCVLFTHTHTHILLLSLRSNFLWLRHTNTLFHIHTRESVQCIWPCAHTIVQLCRGTHAPLILESLTFCSGMLSWWRILFFWIMHGESWAPDRFIRHAATCWTRESRAEQLVEF